MGAPTKLNDITAARIVKAVRAGMSRAGAAAAAGIGRSTLLEYLAKARKGEQPYADFLDRVTRAEGEIEEEIVDALVLAAKKGSVQAMTTWLTMRRPHDWQAKPTAPEADEQDAGELSDEMKESLIAALRST